MSFYRPGQAYDDLPPPSPPPEMPPLPRGSASSSNMYQFRADSWRPNNAMAKVQRENEFSFRSNDTASQYPPNSDQHIIPNGDRMKRFSPNEQRDNDGATGTRRTRRNGSQPHRGRGNRQVYATADRPLMRFQRGITPDQMLGMNDDNLTEKRFLNADDLSDSNEESMDESDSNEYEPKLEDCTTATKANELTDDGKVATNGTCLPDGQNHPVKNVGQVSEPITPRWSNPEYYTALPPPDESQRKKKDVVRLIRKARIAVPKNKEEQVQVVANDDFISLDFGDDHDESIDPRYHGRGMPGAPSGPRTFSHLQNLHDEDSNHPPGSNGAHLPAHMLGPPPSPHMPVQHQGQKSDTINIDNQRKRKRAVDEYLESELSRPPKRKRGIGGMSNGYVLEEWSLNGNGNPVPWIFQSHKVTENPGFRLHKEICDFYDFVKPRKYEQVVREELLGRLQKVMKDYDETCELRCFGSFAAGLYLPTADMDLVVVSRYFLQTGVRNLFQSTKQMHRLGSYLKQTGIAEHDSVEVISGAKVPIVKFVDRITSLKVDMSFENDTGLIANVTFDNWKEAFPALPIIVTIIKQFLMMRGLNEVANGGLGGFSVTCLVTSLLHNIPRIQTSELKAEQHLGEILLEFLDLYGNQFDISRTGIMMNPPGYFDKRRALDYNPRKADRLAIIDPNKPDNDISGGSRNIMLIFSCFSRAREEILVAMSAPNRPSLLDWMLGGNYNTFLWQRQRLRRLYKIKHGSPEPEYLDRDIPKNLHLSSDKKVKTVHMDFVKETSLIDGPGFHHNENSERLSMFMKSLDSSSELESLSKEFQRPTKPTRPGKPTQPGKPMQPGKPTQPEKSKQAIKKEETKLKTSMCDFASPFPSMSGQAIEIARKTFQTAVDERANLLNNNGQIKRMAIQEAGRKLDLREFTNPMFEHEEKATELVNQHRSTLFKLEHPEVAANMDVPESLTAGNRKGIVKRWETLHGRLPPPVGSLSRPFKAIEMDGHEAPNSLNDAYCIPSKDVPHRRAGRFQSSIKSSPKSTGTSENPIIID